MRAGDSVRSSCLCDKHFTYCPILPAPIIITLKESNTNLVKEWPRRHSDGQVNPCADTVLWSCQGRSRAGRGKPCSILSMSETDHEGRPVTQAFPSDGKSLYPCYTSLLTVLFYHFLDHKRDSKWEPMDHVLSFGEGPRNEKLDSLPGEKST